LKQSFLFFAAVAFGAAVGSLAAYRLAASAQPNLARLTTRELVIVDTDGRARARIDALDEGAILHFYGRGSNPALEIGVRGDPAFRFIRFIGGNNKPVAGISSSPPDGHTTLFLGDERAAGKVVVGAMVSDLPGIVDDWGLDIHQPGSISSLLSLWATMEEKGQSKAGIMVVRGNGQVWAVK
jgi:hypothetical protein